MILGGICLSVAARFGPIFKILLVQEMLGLFRDTNYYSELASIVETRIEIIRSSTWKLGYLVGQC